MTASAVAAAPASGMPLRSTSTAPAADEQTASPHVTSVPTGAQVIASAVGTRKLGRLTAAVEVMVAGDTPADALRGARKMLGALDAKAGAPAGQRDRTGSQRKSKDDIHDVIPMTPFYGFTWPGAIGTSGPDHPI